MKPPILLATISLDRMAGGLEKNIVLLANYFASQKVDTHLVTFDTQEAKAFYKIDRRVNWHKTGVGTPHAKIAFSDRLRIIGNVRRAILEAKEGGGNPILVCFHHGILARFFIAALFLRVKIIGSERNSLSIYKYIRKRKWNLNFLLLSFVAKIVVQFAEYASDYPFWMRHKILAIPNPILEERSQAKPGEPGADGRFRMLNVGRLSAQKQQGLLVRAFAGLAAKYPDWDLVIVGDGALRHSLEEAIERANLNGRVKLVGKSKDVSQWLQEAHIFCLPSQWEGFPNALGEAMAHGLPSVGYSSCEGVNKLMRNNQTGLLAEGSNDMGSLRLALEALIRDPALRTEMGSAALEYTRMFSPEKVYLAWVNMIRDLS